MRNKKQLSAFEKYESTMKCYDKLNWERMLSKPKDEQKEIKIELEKNNFESITHTISKKRVPMYTCDCCKKQVPQDEAMLVRIDNKCHKLHEQCYPSYKEMIKNK